MEFNDDNILRFWQWFVKNENTIKECVENTSSKSKEYVVEQMNEHILGQGVLTWDIGLNDSKEWFLMLSPNGDSDMLKVSERIIGEAPEHMNWQFHASKPAKIWDRQFMVYDDYMDELFIDASDWHFITFEEEDGKLDLVIEAKNISHLNPELAESASEQFVIQEIGEANSIIYFSSVVVVSNLESEDQSLKSPVSELNAFVKEYINSIS
jgi:hypothetical protein